MEQTITSSSSVDDTSLNKEIPSGSPLENLQNVPKKASSITTLEPFVPINGGRKKRQNYVPHPALSRFDTLFGIENWSRFLILKTETKITSGILENKLLNVCPTADLSFRLTKPNEWLVEATTKNQSDKILAVKEINGIPVEVKGHDTLNYIQGTVVLPNIQDEEIPDNIILLNSLKLRYNNIHDIETYEIQSRKNQNKLRIMKIKFIGQSTPLKIKILGQNREVRPFIPKPLQCSKCCRYGHTHKRCTNKEICAVCGSQHHRTDWSCNQPKCINCGLDHHAKSKTCEFYIYNTEVKLLMSRSGMSAREAKLELRVRGLLDPSKNPSYRATLYGSNSKDSKNNKMEENKNNTLEGFKSENRFEALAPRETESSNQEEMEDEEIGESRKRNLEKSPPKQKMINIESININMPSVKPKRTKFNGGSEANKGNPPAVDKRKDTNEKIVDVITPSPIFSRPTAEKVQSLEIRKKHDELCGCHECFMDLCHLNKNITKDSLIVLIKNFIRCRRRETTDLSTHKLGCMCVNHIICYKEKNIHILDTILEKLNLSDKKDLTSKLQNQTETNKEQNKYTLGYSKVNSKATTSVNRKNLTTLT